MFRYFAWGGMVSYRVDGELPGEKRISSFMLRSSWLGMSICDVTYDAHGIS